VFDLRLVPPSSPRVSHLNPRQAQQSKEQRSLSHKAAHSRSTSWRKERKQRRGRRRRWLSSVGFSDATARASWIGLVGVFGAQVDAIGSAVGIRVGVCRFARAYARFSLVRIVGTQIQAIESPVVIGVNVGLAASAITEGGLVWIIGAKVDAVDRAVLITVAIGYAATTGSRLALIGVVRAEVGAVGGPVSVPIVVCHAASARPRRFLVGIIGAEIPSSIDAIRYAVRIIVGVGHSAATIAWRRFFRIIRAKVRTILDTVSVVIDVWETATAYTRFCLDRVIRTEIAAIRRSVAVAVLVVVAARTNIDVVADIVPIDVRTRQTIGYLGLSASTLAGRRLVWILIAEVIAIGRPIVVAVGLGHAASTCPWVCLV
jgi:hypothetical protein